jgi:hypothetical protein
MMLFENTEFWMISYKRNWIAEWPRLHCLYLFKREKTSHKTIEGKKENYE